ncbi:hypothetical protein JCM10212_004902 [Sporobolomyces blumeae]
MSVLRDWQEIRELLSSDKIKQRAEGISRCREFLSSKRNFKALHENRNHSWLDTLQALFHIVIIERNAAVSKQTAATEKRLDEATQIVRWLAEKVFRIVPRKVAKAMVNHFTQMVAVSGKVQSYALTYVKALRTVLSHPPHLEHLDERQWIDIVTLCFSAVLGDKVKIGQDFAESEAMNIDDDDEAPGGALRAGSDDEFAVPSKTKRTANALEIELVSCLEVVFRSKSSPFLTYAQAIFRKFLRFFRLFGSETTAHFPAVVALNRALAELDLNDQRSMRRLGPHLWSHIVPLWPTKNSSLKEHVVVALRYLFPFVAPRQLPHHSQHEPAVVARARELYDIVLTEPTIRWREGFSLDIDHLELGLELANVDRQKSRPFCCETFRMGSGFDERHAVAWSVAELGADALARIYETTEIDVARDDGDMSETARGKRRKIEGPLSTLLDVIEDPAQPASSVTFRLAIVLFLVERHWRTLDVDAGQRILATTARLLSHPDLHVERWAFLLVAALARFGPTEERVSPTSTPMPSQRSTRESASAPDAWDQIWLLALRKVALVETCRPAAHAANLLLALDRTTPAVLVDSIEGFARDVDIQGPNFPSDSVCLFLEWCLVISASDSRLVRLRIPDKVLGWITTGWKPTEGVVRSHSFNQPRPHADPLSVGGLYNLVARLVGASGHATLRRVEIVPDSAIGTQAIELSETSRLRDFIEAKVPPYHSPGSADEPNIKTPTTYHGAGESGGVDETSRTMQRKVSAWLARTLDDFVREGDSIGESYWSAMTRDLARRHLDLAATALTTEGLFALVSPDRPETAAIRSANTVITRLAPTLALAKWHPFERASLLASLDPIFAPLATEKADDYPVFLVPDAASGVPFASLPTDVEGSPSHDARQSERLGLLRTIWKVPSTRDALEELASAFRFIVGAVTQTDSTPPSNESASQAPATQASQRLKELEKTLKNDDFGEVKVTSRSVQILGATSADRAAQACMSMCMRGFISHEMAVGHSNSPVRLQEVVETITSSEGSDAILVAEQAFEAAQSGVAAFGLAQSEAILEYIGSTLLPTYEYGRDERFHLVAIRFLRATASSWVPAEGPAEHFGTLARELCAYYINGLRRRILASWRVRLQLISLFDDYLSIDAPLQHWNVGVMSDDGVEITPFAILPFMLCDPDFRVRFRSSSSTPKLFQILHALGQPERTLFDDIKANLTFNLTESEHVLTQILANVNIIIVSNARRRAPYDLLLDIAAKNGELREVAIAALLAASKRLGLPSLSTLYLEYARYRVWLPTKDTNRLQSDEQVGSDVVQQLPYRAAGFSTLREARRADFARTASWFLQSEHTLAAFQTLCDVTKRTAQDGRLLCFAETVAIAISRHQVDLYYDPNLPVAVLRSKLETLAEAAGADDSHVANALISSLADDIVVETLGDMFTAVWKSREQLACLEHDARAAKTFADLLSLPFDFAFANEPAPPHWPRDQSVGAVVLFDREFSVFNRPAVVVSIVHKLLAKVFASPFVMQKQRQLINLAIVVALSQRSVDKSTLAVLAHGLTGLLSEADLVLFVPAMLRWTIRRWLSLPNIGSGEDTKGLVDTLVRSAHATESLRRVVGRLETIDSFADFLDGALHQICQLSAPEANEAAALWPGRIIDRTALTGDAVFDALASTSQRSDKFALVKAMESDDDTDSTTRARIAWRLMQSSSSGRGAPTPDESLAFADLLFSIGGKPEVPELPELSKDVARSTSFDPPTTSDSGIKQAILRRVLKLASDDDYSLVALAFSTFRFLASVPQASDYLHAEAFDAQDRALASSLAEPSLLRSRLIRSPDERHLHELGSDEWNAATADFPRWVCAFARFLADQRATNDGFYAQLVPLLDASPTFAESILPHLVHSIVLHAHASADPEGERAVSRYLERVLRSKSADRRVISSVVKIASYLRHHPRPDLDSSDPSRFDRWLSVPWVLLADGAVKTDAYLAGVLFLELAHEHDGLFRVHEGRPRDRRSDQRAQALLYDIYAEIDEPDGFYGRQSDNIREALVRRHRHEGRWLEAFQAYGAQHEAQSGQTGIDSSSATVGVVNSLASFGFHRLAMSIFQPARLDGALQECDVAPELPYELAWRTDVWDLPIEPRAASTSAATLYAALRASRRGRSAEETRSAIRTHLTSEVRKLSSVSVDLPEPSTKVLETVLALREAYRLAELGEAEGSISALRGDLALLPVAFDFGPLEIVLSTRISRLRALRWRERREAVAEAFLSPLYSFARDEERSCLLRLSQAARRVGHLQAALNAVTAAHALVEDTRTTEVDRELAHVLWLRGEATTAIDLLEGVQRGAKEKDPLAWATLGEWTEEAHVRNARQVLEECFDPAVGGLLPTTPSHERALVYQKFATFADRQFEALSKSTAEKRARYDAYSRRKEVEFVEINRQIKSNSNSTGPSSLDLEKSKANANAQLLEDRQLVEEGERMTQEMLWRALQNYALALAESDVADDKVFRFCALWMGQSDNDALHAQLKPLLANLPSRKFVFLSYQLSARLSKSSEPSTSARNIRRLVLRLCVDHPFHALFPVHALREGRAAAKGSRRSSSAKAAVPKNSRSQAAAEIFDQVKSIPHLQARVEGLKLACLAYAEWAEFDIKSNASYVDSRGAVRKGSLPIARSMRIRSKLVNVPIPVSTFDLPIDPSGRYDASSFPHIVKYDENFDTAGGIHVPKIVTCIGSDGKRYRQLLKGDDEVRQDAVMEQVFVLVNDLLAQDTATRRRKLRIRTYKVIPLQNRNGLLEFVANTAPLGSCLQRLYDQMAPGLPRKARDALYRVEREHKRIPEAHLRHALPTFEKILTEVKPLMRHLFWQKQKTPSLWFDMRLNYSRSVATTSITGHVLGLGDRHVSNILMDEARGELVHIDFGVAFEQGKRLPIPELIPFRLTQNLIDGFGSSGVDGVFRRCSEETLRVLRERSNIVMTILEVFKHDPLQNWAVSSEMAKRIQGSDEGDALDDLPDDADRALSIVAAKLDTRLSVPYTVNQLIQDATDNRKLAVIFSGWQAYY